MEEERQERLRTPKLKELAQRRLTMLQAEGRELHPIANQTRKLASRFWGSAWMKNLARCEAGGLCLAPGRTLLRHHCVLDIQLAQGQITALVSAQDLYEVHLRITPLADERLETLRTRCSGRIDSLVALLEGQTAPSVLELLCDPENGLMPEPADWHMSCTCPEWSEPCPHAAAAIYAAGLIIDENPGLLFTLRSITPESLLTLPNGTSDLFNPATLSETFGIEIDIAP